MQAALGQEGARGHFLYPILESVRQGQKHRGLTRGNPRESQGLKITALLTGHDLDPCPALGQALKSLEEGGAKEGEGVRQNKVEA